MQVGRRAFLTSASGTLVASRMRTAGEGTLPEEGPVVLNEVDCRIWAEELAEFVPEKLFDAHTHVYRRAFNLDPSQESMYAKLFPDSDLEILARYEGVVLPGHRIAYLAFPSPFRRCDFTRANEFVAREVEKNPDSGALMLAHPAMSAREVEETLLRLRLLGLKPYRRYCSSDIDECRITDFLPEHQIAVADRYGLMVMLHLSMKMSVADWRNIEDLERLSVKYPNVRWILAHCARSYAAWALEKAAPRLKGAPNIWYETSSVREKEAFDILFSEIGWERVLHGSDAPAIAFARGKSITYGFAWGDLTPWNNELDIAPCDGSMTFYLYEQLRAMRRAVRRLGLTREQVEAVFHRTGHGLVRSVAERMR